MCRIAKKLRYPPHMGQSIAESIWGNMFYCWSWKAPKTNPRYRDLAFLCQEVCSALRCGQILPGPEDDASEVYGPSIYTVNEQYIKPVTQQAGKMSWALMRPSRWLGLRAVHQPCLARRCLRVSSQSEAQLAKGCANCLVLHAG